MKWDRVIVSPQSWAATNGMGYKGMASNGMGGCTITQHGMDPLISRLFSGHMAPIARPMDCPLQGLPVPAPQWEAQKVPPALTTLRIDAHTLPRMPLTAARVLFICRAEVPFAQNAWDVKAIRSTMEDANARSRCLPALSTLETNATSTYEPATMVD